MGGHQSMFLELPLISHQYPNEIYDLAKRSDVPPEEIAKSKGIEPQPVISVVHLRYDIVIGIVTITEDSNEKDSSIIDFEDGGFEIVKMNHRKLAKKITRFLHEINNKEDLRGTSENTDGNSTED